MNGSSIAGMELLENRILLSLLGQQLYPSDYAWNQKITNAPVAAKSTAIISSITTKYGDGRLHPDFGQDTQSSNDLYGIPYNVVHGNTTAKVHFVIDGYPSESDMIDVPLPANPAIEGDLQNGPTVGLANRGDSHLIVWDEDNNVAYEMYQASRPSENADGKWHAAGETVWNMKTDSFRTLGWTSADAAGLSILVGLVRPDEGLPVSQGGQGVINHAIRFTLQNAIILNQFIYPASHVANPGNTNAAVQPPMGARFRLKASVDISQLNPESKIIAQAMKDYGMILADNGSNFFFSGASYSVNANNQFALTWNDNDIQDSVHGLKSLTFSDFEVVSLSPAVTAVSPASGAPGTQVTISGHGFSGAAGRLQVLFGSTPATGVTVVDDGHVTATVPTGTGILDVRVQSGTADPGDSQNVNSPIFGYGMSPVSAADQFSFVTDTTPPTVSSVTINDGSIQRSMVNTLTIAFSEPVSLSDGAFSLLKRNGSSPLNVTVTQANPSGDQKTWELTFSGKAVSNGSLPDGRYTLKVSASSVSDLAGNHLAADYSQHFFRLFGDADGDREVDRADLVTFRQSLNNLSGYVWWLDYDGDGKVNSADYLQLRLRMVRPLLV